LQLCWIYLFILTDFMQILGFSTRLSCHLWIQMILLFFFQSEFFYFSSLITLVRASSMILNRSSKSGPACLIPDHWGNQACFFFSPFYKVKSSTYEDFHTWDTFLISMVWMWRHKSFIIWYGKRTKLISKYGRTSPDV
jgi:hypothetical protein